jgi:DNA-binding protein HU-beta
VSTREHRTPREKHVNKTDLIEKVAERLGGDDFRNDPGTRAEFRLQAARAVEEVLNVILIELVEGGTVQVTGFGAFKVADCPARHARNPKTGGSVWVEETKRVRFAPGQNMDDLVNGRKKLPLEDASPIRKAPRGSGTKKK